ncbi:MAG: aminotransferase class V-fold PLP-dependent enzyme, partial [Succinivibrio sp.]|nr:aminotransferase class V-fold PLP-dependent enzyme [Succinivibrio sp.]
MNKPVYFDYAAATPTDPRVIEKMVESLSIAGTFANPHAKDHVYGWEAAEAVENAREQVADLIGASALEITFTSGATESNNLAIFGLAKGLKEKGDKRCHIITSKIEHKAILEACEILEKEGFKVTYLSPREDGVITSQMVDDAITDETFLVTIAQANSVLGAISDIHEIASVCHKKGVFFHSDTAQSIGYLKMDYGNSDIDMVTLTCEKVCGPKGVGALYVKRSSNVPLFAQIYGGGQEKGLRGGTVPTHEVVGLGEAFEILKKEGKKDHERFKLLRERLIDGIKDLEGLKINQSENNLPNILSVSFENIDGHMLLPTLSAIAASTGSACSSSNLKPSYILKAIGLSDEMARA